MRTLVAAALLLAIVRPADALVRYARPHEHRILYLGLFGSGLESYRFDPGARSNGLGGGLFVAYDMTGAWPVPWGDGEQDVNWSFGGRIRRVTSYDDDHRRTSLPIDLVVRISKVHYPREETYIDKTGWPTAVFEADPLVPYLGAGMTLDVPLAGDGTTHLGAIAVAGCERWLAKHAGVYIELELRGMALGGGVMQAGANAGLLLAF